MNIRSLIGGSLAAGSVAAAALIPTVLAPSATADPTPTPASPTASAAPVSPAPGAPAQPADGCSAATLASTISTVTGQLSTYFAAHPDANQALIDAARQPAFAAVGQFDGYFKDHPDEADALRAIQEPLNAYKDRCGLQVSPTDALTVLAEV